MHFGGLSQLLTEEFQSFSQYHFNVSDLLSEIEQRIANAASFQEACDRTVSLLRRAVPHFNWVGIYLKEGDELILGPWDGPEATEHVRIPVGKGICGLAARTGETVIVDDVNSDSRYLACFSETRSEMVVPIYKRGVVIGEIDIDSNAKAAFNAADQALIERVAELLGRKAA